MSETLLRPDWFDLDDEDSLHDFIFAHAEVAILSPDEDRTLRQLGLQSAMPDEWWDAPAREKAGHRLARYAAANIRVTPYVAAPGT